MAFTSKVGPMRWLSASYAIRLGAVLALAASPARAQPGPPPSSEPPAIAAADAFVDSEGINTHFSLRTYVYDPALPVELRRLGIRHVRDGIALGKPTYVAELETVARIAGVRYDLISDGGANAFGTNAQSPESIADFVRSVPNVESIEAPNEYDTRTRSIAWLGSLRSFLPALRAANTGLPIVGPAFTSFRAYDALGDVSRFADFTNVHDYFAGFPPETDGWGPHVMACGAGHDADCGRYASLAFTSNVARVTGPALPIVSTETGYGTSGARSQVDLVTQAKYVPRLLFNSFANGIRRTYLYQLADSNGRATGYGWYGLLATSADYRSHTEKPAFTALASINALLADPGPAFDLSVPPARVRDASAPVHAVWLEKRDRSYWLAIWLGASSYDVDGNPPGDVAVPSRPVAIDADVPATATIFVIDAAGRTHARELGAARTIDVNVTDAVTLVEFRFKHT